MMERNRRKNDERRKRKSQEEDMKEIRIVRKRKKDGMPNLEYLKNC